MANKKKTKKKAAPAKKAASKKAAAPKKVAPKKKAVPAKKAAPKKKAAPPAKKVAAPAKKAVPKKAAAPKKPKKPAVILPTAAEEARFWALLEDAWATQPAEVNEARLALSTREPGEEADTSLVDEAIDSVLENLTAVFSFEEFPKEELVAMDRVLERKMYDIDRAEIQEVTDGSDDGFLYARGYIVVMGKKFYDAVNANPQMAIDDGEAESMCYLPAHVHEQRFGDYPDTGSDISRESCSNDAGWPEN